MYNFQPNPEMARETASNIKNGYYQVLKPLIETSSPNTKTEFCQLVQALKISPEGRNVMLYHHGIQVIGNLGFISEELTRGKFPSEEKIEQLEVSLGQLELAVNSGNSPFLG